ncbi:MAG: 6,7-dimethyl-8-ribityllumazine synthase [Pirellulaceae bacterium]|jgi:6,7-dimethyl-8-ribityllumazine synthase
MSVYSVGLVSAPYHAAVQRMEEMTTERLEASPSSMLTSVIKVQGVFEIPLQVQTLLERDDIDAVITLGAIEEGETGHGVALSNAVFPALLGLSLRFNKPVGLGIIGPLATPEQIESRAEKTAKEATSAVLDSLGC